jgi:endonuclease IV
MSFGAKIDLKPNHVNLVKELEKMFDFIEVYYKPISVESLEGSGATPEESTELVKKSNCGFVLDFAHAYHASVAYQIDYKEFVSDFMKLNPVMFHLYDGIAGQEYDTHLPLGKGNLDIPFFLSLIDDKDVTLEISPPTLENYIDALRYLKKCGSLISNHSHNNFSSSRFE